MRWKGRRRRRGERRREERDIDDVAGKYVGYGQS